jgi:hypothetical protein
MVVIDILACMCIDFGSILICHCNLCYCSCVDV